MKEVFIVADNIVSPLGYTSADNFTQLCNSNSGISLHENEEIFPRPFYASLFGKRNPYKADKHYTMFEKLLIASIKMRFLR